MRNGILFYLFIVHSDCQETQSYSRTHVEEIRSRAVGPYEKLGHYATSLWAVSNDKVFRQGFKDDVKVMQPVWKCKAK